MAVDPIAPAAAADAAPESSKATTGANRADGLGRDAFLRLLIVQLQNQDPTSPQSNTEFIAELAQFSALEQLTSINTVLTSLSELLTKTAKDNPQADESSAIERNT